MARQRDAEPRAAGAAASERLGQRARIEEADSASASARRTCSVGASAA